MSKFGMSLGIALLAALAIAGCGSDDSPASVADGVTQTVRQELKSGASEAAPGELLELTRVIIPAGAEIAPHKHPGVQLAFISEGTLTYTVIDGEAEVTRDAAGSNPTVETYSSGDSLKLEVGDSIREPQGMVHMASNEGDEAVVIYLASLFERGAPASSQVQ